MKKFALVLGGGAAKGYAHIGVLKVLEENGIKPDLIVGTSMGAMVGGMYASGLSIEELTQMACKFKSIGHFSLFKTIKKGHILNVNRVNKFLSKAVDNKKIEDCRVKFVSVASNLDTAKRHLFRTGPLKDAIMASISIPGVFPNFVLNGAEYCDGGLVDQVAEDVAREILPDAVVISVDPIGDYKRQKEVNKYKVVETVLNASMLVITNVLKERGVIADLRLTVTQPEVSQMDFSKENAIQAITNGETVAHRNLNKIKQLLEEE